MAKQNIASQVRTLVEDTVTSLGYELWDVEYVKDGAFWYLRITIDIERGIDIDDCEKVHRAIEPIIDQADPIEEQYFLEVSSPGLERELRTPEHFERFLGERVVVKLFSPVQGKRQYVGTLVAYGDTGVTVAVDGTEYQFEKSVVSKVNLFYDFDAQKE